METKKKTWQQVVREKIHASVNEIFNDDDKTMEWLSKPNKDLGYDSPTAKIAKGEAEDVIKLLGKMKEKP